jgi:hypothetical protein
MDCARQMLKNSAGGLTATGQSLRLSSQRRTYKAFSLLNLAWCIVCEASQGTLSAARDG